MSEITLPKALDLSEEDKKVKSFVVGTISIDENGIWNVHYIGPHLTAKKRYFGNGVDSSLNLRQLLNVVGSRLSQAKPIFTAKIQELQHEVLQATDLPDESGTGFRDSTDDGSSIS